MYASELLSIVPQLDVGGWRPKPKKLKIDSEMMLKPTYSVAITVMGPIALGKICRKIKRRSLAPKVRAASKNSRSFNARNSPRTIRAAFAQEKTAMRITIDLTEPSEKMAPTVNSQMR